MEKKTLIVNYAGLSVGGIEKFIGRLMKYAVSQGHRVIWFTYQDAFKDALQRDVADNPEIEKVFFASGRRKFWSKNPVFNLDASEDVVMISFIPEDYVWAEEFRKKYKCNTFYHHLILMNFFGWLTYPEDEFNNKLLSKMRASYSKKIAKKLDENNCIRAFNEKQLVAFKERYDLQFEVSKDLCLKSFPFERGNLEEINAKKAQTRSDKFIITTCARFQFPHKGYLLGLLDVYAKLKEKYPFIKLIVVGDGEKEVFFNKYNQLEDYVKNSIELKGQVLSDELVDIYMQSHMAIGLAGAITTAASCGIPSLVVRHDTLNCETYGFYQDVDSVLKSDPGVDIIPYIEKVINFSNDDYIKIGVDAYSEVNRRLVINPDYILKESNRSSELMFTRIDFFKNKIWAFVSMLKKYIKKL